MIYTYAIVGITLITRNRELLDQDETFRKIVHEHFRDLPGIMLTLVAFVNLDSIAGVYEPMIRKDWRLFFYFFSFIVIVSIVTMNLVTAVVVERALAQAEEDKEMQELRKQQQLESSFPAFV